MSRKMVSAEDFVKSVITYRNVGGVATALGVTPSNVYTRWAKYRKLGVKLPVMRRKGTSAINVSELNKLIKGLK